MCDLDKKKNRMHKCPTYKANTIVLTLFKTKCDRVTRNRITYWQTRAKLFTHMHAHTHIYIYLYIELLYYLFYNSIRRCDTVTKTKTVDFDDDPELERQASDIVNQSIQKALAEETQ